jgi:hypothetical protein
MIWPTRICRYPRIQRGGTRVNSLHEYSRDLRGSTDSSIPRAISCRRSFVGVPAGINWPLEADLVALSEKVRQLSLLRVCQPIFTIRKG